MDAGAALRMQAATGMGLEDAQMIVESQAETGVEPTYCMGDDIPLPVLSDKPHMLYNYFKQRFAQARLAHTLCCSRALILLNCAVCSSYGARLTRI